MLCIFVICNKFFLVYKISLEIIYAKSATHNYITLYVSIRICKKLPHCGNMVSKLYALRAQHIYPTLTCIYELKCLWHVIVKSYLFLAKMYRIYSDNKYVLIYSFFAMSNDFIHFSPWILYVILRHMYNLYEMSIYCETIWINKLELELIIWWF